MKRNWFNWFSKDTAHRRGARSRPRLGAGFEAIEPRLLMARDAIVFEIAPRHVDFSYGDTSLVDVDIAPANQGRGDGPAKVSLPADQDRQSDQKQAGDTGGFIDIGGEDFGRPDGGFGTSQEDGYDRGGYGGTGETYPADGGVDVLLTPPGRGPSDDATNWHPGASQFNPAETDPIFDWHDDDPNGTGPFAPPVGGLELPPSNFEPPSAGPLIPDPFPSAPSGPGGVLGPAATFPSFPGDEFDPGAAFDPGPRTTTEQRFESSTRQPDRLPTPLPDSGDQAGGAIDITPRGPLGQQEDAVAPLPSPSARGAKDATDGTNSSASLKATESEISLRASRGESQAFELATSNWRRDRLAMQRVAPPKPDEIVPATKIIAAANETADDASDPPVEQAVDPQEETSAARQLTTIEVEEIAAELALLPELQQALIDKLSVPGDEGDADTGAAVAGRPSCGRASKLGSLELVAAPLDDRSRQQGPASDHDTARMVGVGLIVIASHAGAMYFQSDRPQVPRTSLRDWELEANEKRS